MLWRDLWLNVLTARDAASLSGNPALEDLHHIFPWLRPTRTSEGKTGTNTTPEDVHPLQMYWAMPWRIRVQWGGEGGVCDLCGGRFDLLVRSFVAQNHGVNYEGGWRHPLTPYYQDKGQWRPHHGQPGGITYDYWLGFALGQTGRHPATVVRAFESRRLPNEQLRLWTFGYDTKQAKTRCWYETTLPLYHVPEAIREDFATRVQTLVETATLATSYLRDCVKQAWFSRPGDDRRDVSGLSQAFFDRTEAAFYATVEKLIQGIPTQEDYELLRAWHGVLCEAAFGLFESRVASGDAAFGNPRRVAAARQNLRDQLHGKKLQGRLVIEKEVA